MKGDTVRLSPPLPLEDSPRELNTCTTPVIGTYTSPSVHDTGTTDISVADKKGHNKLTALSDADGATPPDNPTPLRCLKAPVSFKVGLQGSHSAYEVGLTEQSTMEAELVAAALAMKEVLFCFGIMIKLGFGEDDSSVQVYINNTATLHVAGNRTHNGRAKHVAPRNFLVRELSKKKIHLHHASTANRIAGTTPTK